MDELISKKEVLKRYGISYGALYRWKRKGLIPEEWFIKRATPTGQETYFIQELICERIEMILGSKLNSSLDEIGKSIEDDASEKLTIIISGQKVSFELSHITSVCIETGNQVIDLTARIKEKK